MSKLPAKASRHANGYNGLAFIIFLPVRLLDSLAARRFRLIVVPVE
jgi:hypothetical protein